MLSKAAAHSNTNEKIVIVDTMHINHSVLFEQANVLM